MSIIISIKPRYSKLIFEGKKTIEIRKRFYPFVHPGIERFQNAYVYSSAPDKELLGYFKIEKIYNWQPRMGWENLYANNPEKLAKIPKRQEVLKSACISEEEFEEYFKKCWTATDVAHLLYIKSVHAFENPIPLKQLQEGIGFRPPISWRYASEEMVNFLKDKA